MNEYDPLIDRDEVLVDRLGRLVERPRRLRTIPPFRPLLRRRAGKQIRIKPLDHVTHHPVIHGPHRPHHAPKPRKLHRRGEMEDLVGGVCVPDGRVARGEEREFACARGGADDVEHGEGPVEECKGGVKGLLEGGVAVAGEVGPWVGAEGGERCVCGAGVAGEGGEGHRGGDEGLDEVEFRVDRAEGGGGRGGCGLADGDEGGQWWSW